MAKSDSTWLVVALALVWWIGRSRPVPSVSTSSQWFDPVSQSWRDF